MQSKEFLNKIVTVTIDRPLYSKHPKFNYTYPINYGYIPDTVSGDGEELYQIKIKRYTYKFKEAIKFCT